MTGATHKLGGIISGSAASLVLRGGPLAGMISIGLGIFGATLPDADKKNTTISNKVPILAFLIWVIQKIVGLITLPLPKAKRKKIKSIVGHRGMTHTIAAAVFVALITLIISLVLKSQNFILYTLSIFLGMMSHIVLDAFSNGVMMLMPFSFEKITWGNIKTRSFREKLVMLILLPQAIILLYMALI